MTHHTQVIIIKVTHPASLTFTPFERPPKMYSLVPSVPADAWSTPCSIGATIVHEPLSLPLLLLLAGGV